MLHSDLAPYTQRLSPCRRFTTLMRPSHPVRHFGPLRNHRFFCSRLRSVLLLDRLGMHTRLTPMLSPPPRSCRNRTQARCHDEAAPIRHERRLLASNKSTRPRETPWTRRLSRWRHEHVANAAHGPNGIGVRRIGLDLAAQTGDTQIYGAVERLHFAVSSHLQ
jgi:hypothetical protein